MITETSEANVVIEDSYPMLLIGRDHRVSYANARAHQLLGYEHGGLHGLSIEQLLLPSRRAEVRNVQAVLVGQASRRWKSAFRDGTGASVEVHLSVEPCLDHRGQVIAVKVRAERAVRSRPPLPQEHFDSGSGTRRIVPVPGSAAPSNPPPLDSVEPAARPKPSSRSAAQPSSQGAARVPPASRPSLEPARPTSPASPRASMAPSAPSPASRVPRTTAAERPQPKAARTSAAPKGPPPVNSVRPPPPVSSVRPPPPPVQSVRPPARSEAPSARGSRKGPPPLTTLTPAQPVAAFRTTPTVRTLRPEAPVKPASPPPRVQSNPPAPEPSQTLLTSPPPAELVVGGDATEQLETALQLLGWLRSRVESGESLDDARERARMNYILTEATEAVAQVRCDVRPRSRRG